MKYKSHISPKMFFIKFKKDTKVQLTNFVEIQARKMMCGLKINPQSPFHWNKYILLSTSNCKPSSENNQPFPESEICLTLKSHTCILQTFSYEKAVYFMASFQSWGSPAPRLKNHHQEIDYFQLPSSQEFLVLTSSTSQGWKTQLECGDPGLVIQCPNH